MATSSYTHEVNNRLNEDTAGICREIRALLDQGKRAGDPVRHITATNAVTGASIQLRRRGTVSVLRRRSDAKCSSHSPASTDPRCRMAPKRVGSLSRLAANEHRGAGAAFVFHCAVARATRCRWCSSTS
jgi:hypothetical protein